MTIFSVISALAVIVIIMGVLVLLRRKKEAAGHQESAAKEDVPATGAAVFDDEPRDTAGTEKAAILEAYPVLQSIPYVQAAAGAYPLTAPLVKPGIKTMLLSKISVLPIGTPALSLLGLLQNPESNTREVISLVSTNPSFSAKVLQAVNSAFFRQAEKVTSIGRAITLLGFNNVRALILDDLLSNSIPVVRERDKDAYMRIWTHSAVVSAVAGHIGKHFQLPEYTLGTIGLLHDIGKYFLETVFRPDGDGAGHAGIIREDRQYGINHAVIGAIIAEKWQLPHIITDSIEHHHSPGFVPPEDISDSVRRYSLAIYIADLISNIMGVTSENPEFVSVRPEYSGTAGFTGDVSDYITPELIMDIEKANQTVRSYMKTR